MTLEADGIKAVLDTHIDLEAWIGRGDPAAWRRFEAAIADDFTMVTPDGVRCSRGELMQSVAQIGGSAGDGFRIRIDAAGAHAYGDSLAVVVYREAQTGGDRPETVRWSTALFSRAADGAILWRHLHECWTDETGATGGPAAGPRAGAGPVASQ